MLADPRHSRIVLINLARGEQASVAAEFATRRRASLTLLPFCQKIFGVSQTAVGEYERSQLAEEVAHSIAPLDVDGLSLWLDQRFTDSLAASNVGVVVLGGAWLEEDVFIAALEGVRRGYDVRLLADLSTARVEADRSLVLDRLALHGVLTTTVRQALLEWAVCLDDASLKQRVRQLLS
ncbi:MULTISPECIES: isochorismatase family protein [Bradyrhizobium]|jgi:hypothetical protein|uniref:Isochorismatase family protein n=2 Tax=Bradyrhizobium TaxID=374 RepID=A0ABY0P7I2_9BRAD|nr:MULTISPECIES: isochorismatase family protein [Bradyrhizobium]SDH59305.1 Isochorismatase family protein [Bradyrhizobium ottawaense]SEE21622.1 Isochorismatase family protein [Bradyrhizobium lablabi]SHM17817.1 Isochorismatase family protein [Bradyrhizobium lablabi]